MATKEAREAAKEDSITLFPLPLLILLNFFF